MSNSLAVAAVTSTIRYVVDRALQAPHVGPVGGALVSTLRPEDLADTDLAGSAGVNVYCYLVTPNHAWNLTDLPTRRSDGSAVQRPIAALDLHYLITCYGAEPELEPQRLLGRTVGALSATSVLSRDVVTAALDLYGADSATLFLTDSDLASEVELVKLSPVTLSLEEMSKLWGVLDTTYQLSMTYLATVVLIAAEVTPRAALPVQRPALTVSTFVPTRLVDVVTDAPGDAVSAGSTLVLRGSGLVGGPGTETMVRLGPALLLPEPDGNANEVRVVLTDDVPAGVLSAQVAHRSVAGAGAAPSRSVGTSNALPIVVRPQISVDSLNATEVTFGLSPALQPEQRVSIVLSRLSAAVAGVTNDVDIALTPIASGGAPLSTVTLAHGDIPEGTWLVRLRVDGTESLPTATAETYDQPALTLPPP